MGWSIPLKYHATLCEGEDAISPGPQSVITTEAMDKFKGAVRIVPVMLACAKLCLDRVAKIKDAQKADAATQELLYTLHKFFSLKFADNKFQTIVGRLQTVYDQCLKGIMGGYNLYTYSFTTTPTAPKGNAYVPGNLKKGSEALGKFFANNEDMHWPWDEVQKMAYEGMGGITIERREIHINLDYVNEEKTTPDILAKTIIHEATHKWAGTDDVCYRHNTLSKVLAKEDVVDMVRQGFLERIQRADDKFKVPFSAVNQSNPLSRPPLIPAYGKTSFQTNSAMWVKNADSYAWAARRLWKHSENILANYAG